MQTRTTHPDSGGRTVRRGRRELRGFTLLEAIMAASILVGIVTAVTSAVVAGQQHAFEAQQRISAALAAEALLGHIITQDYNAIATWDGYTEAVGAMVDEFDRPMPPVFDGVGRRVNVSTSVIEVAGTGVRVRGRTVVVRSFDVDNRVLIELSRFVAEPQP